LRAEALRADVEKIAGMPLRSFGDADPVGLGALVTIEDEQLGRRRLFVAPAGGGTVIGGDVQVTTPSAPLGKALIGARRGDSVELERAGATVELDVVAVR
jgi:transcription elongation GreA/GreB family factor